MSFTHLPTEIMLRIMLNLDHSDLANCRRITGLSQFCQEHDSYFWYTKLTHDLRAHAINPIDRKIFNRTELSSNQRYVQLMTFLTSRVFKGSEKYVSPGTCLITAIERNQDQLIDYFIHCVSTPSDILWVRRYGIYTAAKHGHVGVMKTLRSQFNADINWGLIGAAAGGHKTLIDYCMSHGATNYRQAIEYARHYGHSNLVSSIPRIQEKYDDSLD
jgi:hypothetical protein